MVDCSKDVYALPTANKMKQNTKIISHHRLFMSEKIYAVPFTEYLHN